MNRKKKRKYIDIIIIVCLVIFDISVLLGFIYWYFEYYYIIPLRCPVVSSFMTGCVPILF